ncbi:superoxide dismutase [Desulfohalovibrio reitneri]|uniref:superoxide dismutase n=1 Tax=Desulfohalovibrio reitneri TaxID=1307759 RepID=UPI000AE32487|nr:superoxide dismutase [Desulfohalovibrio reitneri]
MTDRRTVLKMGAVASAALLSGGLGLAGTAWSMEGPVRQPPLPYPMDALEPVISERTLSFHYGKHHAGYVAKTNKLLEENNIPFNGLEELVIFAYNHPGMDDLFDNASQVWNHTFYWNSMKPGGSPVRGRLKALAEESFGSVGGMKDALKRAASTRFGSGYAWLIYQDGRIKAMNSMNALSPLVVSGAIPLLTVDVWEHAYYLDYQNRRGEYMDMLLDNAIDWDFADANLP